MFFVKNIKISNNLLDSTYKCIIFALKLKS